MTVSSRQRIFAVERGQEALLEVHRDISLEKRTHEQLAVIRERERFGHVLTDNLVHSIFAVGLGLQAEATRTSDPSLQERLETSIAALDDVVRDLRRFIFDLGSATGPEERAT